MRRVVRPGGVVCACTWDYGEGMQMLRAFWTAATALEPDAPDEGRTMRYRSTDELNQLWLAVGMDQVETDHLTVQTEYSDFEDFWEPFTLGIGPAGSYLAALEPGRREALRERLFEDLGSPTDPITLRATASAVRGRA